jgi:hypothetical protein
MPNLDGWGVTRAGFLLHTRQGEPWHRPSSQLASLVTDFAHI